MTVVTTSHIATDERGVGYLEGTQTRVVQIVMDKMNGLGAEEIHASYPYLSLVMIYAALSFYYDHQVELDVLIAREREAASGAREAAIRYGAQPTRANLEARFSGTGNRGW